MCKKLAFVCAGTLVLGLLVPGNAQEPDPSMLGWWKLDEGQGDVAIDSSGRDNHGIISNLDAGLGDGGSVWVEDPERGTALSFDGSAGGAYVYAGEIPQMTLEIDFTWAFWAIQDPANTTPNDIILGNRRNEQQADFVPRQFI